MSATQTIPESETIECEGVKFYFLDLMEDDSRNFILYVLLDGEWVAADYVCPFYCRDMTLNFLATYLKQVGALSVSVEDFGPDQ